MYILVPLLLGMEIHWTQGQSRVKDNTKDSTITTIKKRKKLEWIKINGFSKKSKNRKTEVKF